MSDLARKDMTEGRSKYFNFKFIRDLNIETFSAIIKSVESIY